MTKPKTILTMPMYKLIYRLSRKSSKKRNPLCVPNVSKMDEEEYLRCMEIVKSIKNGK